MVNPQATTNSALCELCRSGEYLFGQRNLNRIAVQADGPIFLYRCETCGALWLETLRYAALVSAQRARELFTDIELEDSPTC